MNKIAFLMALLMLPYALAHGGVDDGDGLEIDANAVGTAYSYSHLYNYMIAAALVGTFLLGYYLYDKYKAKLK